MSRSLDGFGEADISAIKRAIALALLLLPSLAFGEKSGVIGDFRGLHNSEASILINDNEAQDLSNVDFSATGKSILKRDGYSLYQSVGTSTRAVTGTYYFKDVDGDDTLVAAIDSKVYKSQTSGTFAAFVTTDTTGAYYDFVDSQGFLWRANSEHDQIWRYDGATLTWYPNHPKGDQIEALPDRLVISGTIANPNRLNFSGAADFTTFTVGALETDPFYEDVFLPGQKITAIKAACGGVITWSKESMAFYQGTNQYDGRIDQISDNVGTLQPSSIINDLGIIHFQGQDGHFYSYDCNTISKLSSNLDVSGFANGSPKSWNQSAYDDFVLGTDIYTSPDISIGDVVLGTWTVTDSGNANFALGSFSSTFYSGDRVYLSTNNTNVLNNGFESCTSFVPADWTISDLTGVLTGCGTIFSQSGTYHAYIKSASSYVIKVFDASSNLLDSDMYSPTVNGPYTQRSIDLSSYSGRYIYIQFISGSKTIQNTAVFLASGDTLTWYDAVFNGASTSFIDYVLIDTVAGGRSTTFSGTFTSQAFNTGFSSSAWLVGGVDFTTSSHAISLQTQTGPDGSSWDSAVAWSTASAPASDFDKYIRYVVTLSTGGATNGTALPYISSTTFNARASSGTFISQTKEIGLNATSFGNFARNQSLNGGNIVYSIRTNKTEASLSTSTWVTLTPDSKITATINPWIQIGSTFTITVATQVPTLQDFTVNWNEGALTRHWGIPDKEHRLLWSVAEGADTYPSVSYIFDQRFGSWLKYSFPFFAPSKSGANIYWGSPSVGKVYQYPSGSSDDSVAITAYWKSKDFVGVVPFVEKDFNYWSVMAKAETGSNIDMTYTIDTTSSTLTSISLTDPNSLTVRRRNDYFLNGLFGSFINFKFGNDDLSAPFELYGFTYDYTPRSWRVME